MRPSGTRKGWAIERWIFVLATGAAILTAAVQISQKVKAPVWLFVTLYAFAGLVAIAAAWVALRQKRSEDERAWEQEVTSLLALGPGRGGRLPRVSEVSPYELGVSRSTYAPDDAHRNDPYVDREVDGRLREAIRGREPPFVIVVGDSKAGKSRTLYEAVLAELPQAPLIVPAGTEAIGKLFSLDPPLDLSPAPAVLWLDDLDEAGLGALTPGLLDRLGREVVVVASMTSQRRARIANSEGDIGRAARVALNRAKEVHLDAELTDEERAEAKARYPDERFDHGIGEPLVAVDRLTAKFYAGRTDSPVGHALVLAAIDWRRAGLGRPILDSELRRLYPEYLPSIRAGLEASDELYEEGFKWACDPLASHVALLEKMTLRTKERGYVAFDYLVALLDGQEEHRRRNIPPFLWGFAADSLPEEEATAVATTAYLRGERGGAERILRTLMVRSSVASAWAAYHLGVMLSGEGDTEAAKAAYQKAIDSGHHDWAPRAEFNLGVTLAGEGDTEGAKAAYQKAIDSGHHDTAPKAALYVGMVLEVEGDTEGAEDAYRRAIDSGHRDVVPVAKEFLQRLR